jgi:DNA polymerase V
MMEILKLDNTELTKLPFIANRISCGFPSPADDYIEGLLNLNEKLIPRPSSTFLVKAEGDSMIGAGIFEGDLLIVDKSIKPAHNQIVVAVINGEFSIKRLIFRFPKTFLQPENIKYKTLEVNAEMNFQVWGVVTYAIHGFSKLSGK